jgi:hypothetical protein
MISIHGKLAIKIINGRNGAFRVGALQSDIGEFSIKDKLLDQYEEGAYEGMFVIERIFPSSYLAGNRVVTEIRAIVSHIDLTGAEMRPVEVETVEPDPLEEEKVDKTESSEKAAHKREDDVQSESTEETDRASGDPDKDLFGLLWPLGETVKLDATIDRVKFRQQRDRLKALGYQFKPISQTWIKESI